MNKLLLAVVASIAMVAVAATSMKLLDKDIIVNMANLLVLIIILSPCICTLVLFIVNFSKIQKKAFFSSVGISMGYALLALISLILLMVSYFINGNGAAELGALYIIYSWPVLVFASLLSAYFAYKKSI